MTSIFGDVFTEMAVLLFVTVVIGALGMRLRQPLIVAFIAVGILVGPSVLGWVSAGDQVDLLAKLGIALLLFVVGLKLDLHIIRTMGPVALATGLGQVFFTAVIGYAIALALGMSPVTALYVAVALTFSSTIIIVKLLSDKREVDALHGRIAIGFLIVQDIVVVLVMIGLTALGEAGDIVGLGAEAVEVLIKGGLFIGTIGLLMRYVLTPLLHQLARSTELLVLFAIAWPVALGALGVYLGFSKEVGAFLAGVSLASTPYREAIGARLVSLRDFLLLFFFIDLGAGLDLATLGAQVVPAIILSLFVLIGNPLIVVAIMGAMGYRKRTGFLAGLAVAQISEFSLILGALGMSLGHIGSDTMGLITLVGLITISASTYMILYSHPLYERVAPLLSVFERKRAYREDTHTGQLHEDQYDVVLFGLGRFGAGIAQELRRRGQRVLGVDFNPDLLHRRHGLDYPVRYGDAEATEFLSTLPLGQVTWLLSSIRDAAVNIALIHGLRDCGYRGRVAVTANSARDAALLREAGADRVLTPFVDAATEAVDKMFAAEELQLARET
ncbi:sodium:proton exchanger [Exilibacterium tricleocarpae]|uniref:Sodium:proton exchanger n=1 Tax=Exilibacterium tricleocarpae TaxID=2591008 RepID=A0A545TAJ2_9GAMM|nr:cation:proton antiporter family protein [Exilibacterium tricleocarpae]TQV74228.1 sodium:proton exchanger [Exilibacterium tricleocarpae]